MNVEEYEQWLFDLSFRLARRERAFPKRVLVACERCGEDYDAVEWKNLPPAMHVVSGDVRVCKTECCGFPLRAPDEQKGVGR